MDSPQLRSSTSAISKQEKADKGKDWNLLFPTLCLERQTTLACLLQPWLLEATEDGMHSAKTITQYRRQPKHQRLWAPSQHCKSIYNSGINDLSIGEGGVLGAVLFHC